MCPYKIQNTQQQQKSHLPFEIMLRKRNVALGNAYKPQLQQKRRNYNNNQSIYIMTENFSISKTFCIGKMKYRECVAS